MHNSSAESCTYTGLMYVICGGAMKLTSTLCAESSSSQLTVVIVAPHQPSPGTVSEDDPQSNAEMGLLSPMLSPRATSSASGVLHFDARYAFDKRGNALL